MITAWDNCILNSKNKPENISKYLSFSEALGNVPLPSIDHSQIMTNLMRTLFFPFKKDFTV